MVVDLAGPAYKCSCPSRKFPGKHALGLLLNWANGTVPEVGAAADFAAGWLAERRAKAEKAEKPVVGTDPGDSPTSAESGPVKDPAAAARRAQQRAAGRRRLAELQSWLSDQVLVGLSATPAATPGRGHANAIAARMVDAQAPGVAGALDASAATESDVTHLMAAVPALVRAIRYGDVRGTPTGSLSAVVDARTVRVCAGLPAAAGGLADDAASVLPPGSPPRCR